MTSYLADERRNRLAQMINSAGSYRVADLAAFFNVTRETIRKDIIYLDQQKLVCRTHGGAVSLSESAERPVHMRVTENTDNKNRIATKALEFLKDAQVVILDSGSTVLSLATMLEPDSCDTIITDSLAVANVLVEKNMSFHIIGGEITPVTLASSGMPAAQMLNMIKADVVFLGSSGFQSGNGPSAKSFCDAEVKQCMIRNSRLKIVLADSSKFITNSLVRYAEWSQIDYLITDHDAPADLLKEMQKKTNVILA